jgi:hypothetical protein
MKARYKMKHKKDDITSKQWYFTRLSNSEICEIYYDIKYARVTEKNISG